MSVSTGSLKLAFAAIWLAMVPFVLPAAAQDAPPARPSPSQAAWAAAEAALQPGPAEIALRDQATLSLPAGYAYIPVKEATELMKVMGNSVDARFLGLVFPKGSAEANWFVSLDYEDSGYIKDDDAREWDADELLQSLKDGTEAGNEQREQVGVPPIEVTRWVQKPDYDAQGHRLIWSAEIRNKGGADADPGVNYNTYLLGREGYVSLNLVTGLKNVEQDKVAARELLGALQFKDGKRYQDFDSSTDKVAAYGLAALVAGAAAKKLGLLATLGLLLAKFGKIIFVALAAAGAGLFRWWRGRNA
jgi:uncharacterized membrane-anchored protein